MLRPKNGNMIVVLFLGILAHFPFPDYHYSVSKKNLNPTLFMIKWLNLNRFKQILQ